MADRLYLMPLTTDARGRRVPKYFSSFTGLAWSAQDYGPEPWCLVGVTAIPDPLHTTIAADTECSAFPLLANFGNNIGGNLATVQSRMDAAEIPSGWVGAGMTWQTLFKGILFIFQFAQRFNGLMPNTRIFGNGVTLNTTLGSLRPDVRAALKETAESFGVDVSSLQLSDTMRDLFQLIRSTFPSISLQFFGQTW